MNNMKIKTYFCANNKTRICAIWQTYLLRQEALKTLNFKDYDIFLTCEDIAEAQKFLDTGNYKITQIEDFQS